jgi:membrane-bound lytic murein transglycosylase A
MAMQPGLTPQRTGASLHQVCGLEAGAVAVPFAELSGFADDDHAEVFRVFQKSCGAIVGEWPNLRQAAPPSATLKSVARLALESNALGAAQARSFFETHFQPCRVKGADTTGRGRGFFTGYYEPVVEGSLTRTDRFTAPVLAPSPDLMIERTSTEASITACPDRATIEALAENGRGQPIAWLKDKVEVFFAQVQGSARLRLEDGRQIRLIYAGRNGWPYTSIGRILIETGEIAPADMSLARIKQWIRDHGQEPGGRGAALMAQNKSYVFFRLGEDRDPASGPLGGEGIPLTPLRSIAIDRSYWTYGLPVFLSADFSVQDGGKFRRLMIAQDTGTAIVGPARADIFFGTGDEAGTRAGNIRHYGDFVVLLPKAEGFVP